MHKKANTEPEEYVLPGNCCSDPLARYYLHWRNNCLESCKWLISTEAKEVFNISDRAIEWQVEYYEHKALLWWCAHLRHIAKCKNPILRVDEKRE